MEPTLVIKRMNMLCNRIEVQRDQSGRHFIYSFIGGSGRYELAIDTLDSGLFQIDEEYQIDVSEAPKKKE